MHVAEGEAGFKDRHGRDEATRRRRNVETHKEVVCELRRRLGVQPERVAQAEQAAPEVGRPAAAEPPAGDGAPVAEEPAEEAPEEASAGRKVQVEACEVLQLDRFAGRP
ncbi:MAG: hypothetical protein LV473_03690 [Nitrospira sp.]|nr:hypothetical protein [Nitrospira sp.]